LFSGKPDFKKVFNEPYPKLTKAEKDFLENQTQELCGMTSDWEIFQKRDMSKKVWDFMKEEKFFGMIIPKKYGGLGFSALGHSAVVAKLATRSQVMAISTMVPNSLGPAELLLRYGTEKQKDYYLPRLADGRDLPCFALTEPQAGSDAASISSSGEVFKDKDGKIKIKLNFEKRYITLGAVATVIGLAFVLNDPKNLLGKGKKPGITCALIPHKTAGVRLGRRHDPMGVPFVNSPISGKNVVVDVDAVIGGDAGVGKGWLMLMECLAVGRGISLPSTSAGGAKMVARVVSNYSNIRTQFGMSIGKFEAIEEPIARIVGYTYMIEAMRKFVAGAVDGGAKPAVTNAVAKYHSTEKFRTIINDGMDILGGAAIIRGPRNLFAHPYYGTPVGITVEGANIMTRGLIMFGQGAVRCHPYSYNEMKALQDGDLEKFDANFWAHVGHFLSNKIRSAILTATRGYVHIPRKGGMIGRYEQKLTWASARFAFVSDSALAMFGADVKRKETMNGRFGDALSYMLMACCIIKRFEAEGERKEDKDCVEWALKYCMAQTNEAFIGLYDNMSPIFRVHAFLARLNPICRMPSDALGQKLVKALLSDGKFRENLTEEIYLPTDEKEMMAKYEKGFELIHSTKDIVKKLKAAVAAGELKKAKVPALLEPARAAKIITEAEFAQMTEAVALWHDCIMVDGFEMDDYLSSR
jgi:acyl-CoA dehydrogenase